MQVPMDCIVRAMNLHAKIHVIGRSAATSVGKRVELCPPILVATLPRHVDILNRRRVW
jgi:hypothetical protein